MAVAFRCDIMRYYIKALMCSVLCMFILTSVSHADRINHAIEVLEGERVAFGIFSGDRSFENARSLSRTLLDFVIVDMEHKPYDVEVLQTFLLRMTDKRAIADSGSVKMRTTPIVRIPANGRELSQFLVKQVLDVGAFGVVLPMIENREEAENAISSLRFPQVKGSKEGGPVGQRGISPDQAAWYWGMSRNEYVSRADVWPLDTKGELLAIIQIETAKGLFNHEEIISTPGVGAIFIGPTDLSASLGLTRDDPEVEQAIQTILKTCTEYGVPCGVTADANSVQTRVEQGFRIVTVGMDSGVSAPVQKAMDIGRKAAGRKVEH